jgi:DNA processing protein
MESTVEHQEVEEKKIYQVALSMLPLVGGALAKQLINYCGSAEAVFRSPTRHLQRIPGIGEKIIGNIRNPSAILDRAEKEVNHCQQQGIAILSYTDEMYPERLRQIYDVPVVLYYQGNVDLNHARIISVVGTRQATAYGREIVDMLLRELQPFHPVVVSGLAYGIDISVHRAALRLGLPTIGVMGSGIDIIYPALHKKDAMKMVPQGGLLTENPLGTKPDARKFPARNRIIAALCDATVVVEAAEKGGALITANLANDYDREVFAVPGNWGQPYSQGCNKLIREHKAHILSRPQDMVELLNWDQEYNSHWKKEKQHSVIDVEIDAEERIVVDTLNEKREAVLFDVLSWHTSMPVNKLASVLLSLEFKGVVKTLPGKKYQLTKPM